MQVKLIAANLKDHPPKVWEAFQYDPNSRDMPEGFRARTASSGPEAIVPNDEGVHLTMAPFDVAVKMEGGWQVFSARAFESIFVEVS